MATVTIREGTGEDAGELSALLDTLGYPADADTVRARLEALRAADPGGRLLVAVAGGRVIGFAALHTTPVLHRPSAVGRITGIAVHPSVQGSGVGGELLRAAEEHFRALGLVRVEVTSGPMHAAAHVFYRRQGYADQGVRFAKALVLLCALGLAGCGGAPADQPGPIPPPASPPAQFDPWQNARERGIDFRGIGQEPGWYVEVDHERGLRLMWDYADQQAVSTTAVQPETQEGTTLYRVTAGTHQIEVAIENVACKDTMSGEAHPRTVTVNVDGRALRGCGRELAR
jgi:uncharacterized membrane protein/GNAT superfamily N-acetyltransferase